MRGKLTRTIACTGMLCLALVGCGAKTPDATTAAEDQTAAVESAADDATEEQMTDESEVPDGKLIKDDFMARFDALYNPETLKQMLETDEDESEMADAIGIDLDEYIELSYKLVIPRVAGIEIDGDDATLTVELTLPDWEAADEQKIMETLIAEKTEGMDLESLSEEQASAIFAEVVRESMQYPTMPSRKQQFEVPYERVDGVWAPTDSDAIAKMIDEALSDA